MMIINDDNMEITYICDKIRDIHYMGNDINITNLSKCVNLRCLQLDSKRLNGDMKIIYGLRKVRKLHLMIDNLKLELIHLTPSLDDLLVSFYHIIDIHNIVRFKKLARVCAYGGNHNDYVIFNKISKLKYVVFAGLQCNSIPHLPGCKKLRKIMVVLCDHLVVVDNLHMIKNLRHIEFKKCCNLTRVENLKKCKNLIVSKFHDCDNLRMMSCTLGPED